ncbi:hypothetical protein PAB09_05050 [Corynebacterium sp. SCR221107]|uniref:hypothetical protein n=1 Tax=Corynebacterium sp. SCR221107 TaxID=3017361 RepID=UPI0022EC997C|nr:hypothetical protein [Corynebacterium sp. SCR221107]WBT09675.1 hypothetical protein PAB09_05050 [Corynebacterium sp. SCR221107]
MSKTQGSESFIAQLDHAPLPTEATLRRRTSVCFQFFRFVLNNLKLGYLTLFAKH